MSFKKRVTAAVVATSIVTMGGVGLFAETASANTLPAQAAPALNMSTIGAPTVLASNEQPQFWHALVHDVARIAATVKAVEESFRVTAKVVRVSAKVTRVFTRGRNRPPVESHGYLPQDAQFDATN